MQPTPSEGSLPKAALATARTKGSSKQRVKQCKTLFYLKTKIVIFYTDHYISSRATKPVRHDHNMSPVSCKAGAVQGEQGNYYPRSEGIASHTGLSLRPFSILYSVRVPSEIHLPMEQNPHHTGNYRKKAITQVPQNQTGFISQLFLVPKIDGGQRPVINLKTLNRFIRWEHFQMEGLHMLPDVLIARDWMVKIDRKDAYL